MSTTSGWLVMLAAAVTLSGCAHAGKRGMERAAGDEAPATPPVEAAVAPAPSGPSPEPGEQAASTAAAPGVAADETARAEADLAGAGPGAAAEPEGARAPAREVESAKAEPAQDASSASPAAPSPPEPAHRPGAGRGALRGLGAVVEVWGKFCLSHPIVAFVCIAGFPLYWPFAAGALVAGATIGAAIGAEPSPPAEQRPPRPPPAARHRAPEAPERPPAAWTQPEPVGMARP